MGVCQIVATSPDPPPDPPFSWSATFFWSIALFAGAGVILYSAAEGRPDLLEEPERFLTRVWGRELDAAEVTGHLPLWQRFLNAGGTSDLDQTLKEATASYQQSRQDGILANSDSLPRTLAILLAEAGKIEEAQQELKQLSESSETAEFKKSFETAYVDPGAPAFLPSAALLNSVSPEWCRDKLELRLATRRGDLSAVGQIRDRLAERGRRQHQRVSLISLIHFTSLGAGLSVLGWCLRRRCATGPVAQGETKSPWTVAWGYAVLVRGAVLGLFMAGCLALLSESFSLVAGFATVLSAGPLFWLTSRWLLRPYGYTFRGYFGLELAHGQWRPVLESFLILLSLIILGEMVLGLLMANTEISSMAEAIPEEFLFGSWPEVTLSALDAVFWAPLVEEIVFRGLLYTTLRRRLPNIGAAILTASLFSIIHGYSLSGFLVIWWSGFLWALAYEKTRSLWPGILCHAVSNGLAILSPLVLYR